MTDEDRGFLQEKSCIPPCEFSIGAPGAESNVPTPSSWMDSNAKWGGGLVALVIPSRFSATCSTETQHPTAPTTGSCANGTQTLGGSERVASMPQAHCHSDCSRIVCSVPWASELKLANDHKARRYPKDILAFLFFFLGGGYGQTGLCIEAWPWSWSMAEGLIPGDWELGLCLKLKLLVSLR